MKHNIIFAVLTAVILISGFFSMDIVQHFSNSSPEESFQSISKSDNNAVYLSSEREVINPMSIVHTSDEEINPKHREIATNLVNAMSRYSDTTYIAWGVDIPDIYDAWQDGGNNLIYVDKWKYINYGKKSERLLDCIINVKDFRILYIRFYSEENYELSPSEINSGLDWINIESNNFYPNLDVIYLTIEDVLNYMKEMTEWEFNEVYGEYDYEYYNFSTLGEDMIFESSDCFIWTYENMKKFVEKYINDSELYKFWLSPLDITNKNILYLETVYDYELDEDFIVDSIITANPVNFIMDEFFEISSWFHPSYSTKDGRIYQSIALNSGKLYVIYSTKEKIVEGFFFEEK